MSAAHESAPVIPQATRTRPRVGDLSKSIESTPVRPCHDTTRLYVASRTSSTPGIARAVRYARRAFALTAAVPGPRDGAAEVGSSVPWGKVAAVVPSYDARPLPQLLLRHETLQPNAGRADTSSIESSDRTNRRPAVWIAPRAEDQSDLLPVQLRAPLDLDLSSRKHRTRALGGHEGYQEQVCPRFKPPGSPQLKSLRQRRSPGWVELQQLSSPTGPHHGVEARPQQRLAIEHGVGGAEAPRAPIEPGRDPLAAERFGRAPLGDLQPGLIRREKPGSVEPLAIISA